MTIALGRRGWKVVYAEDARAFTETPASLGGLWRQRYRWSFGTMQSVWKHRRAFLRRGEGPIGTIGLPSLVLLQIVLPLLSPLIDVLGALQRALPQPSRRCSPTGSASTCFPLALGAYAFHLDHERPWALWALPLQNFLYRQLMYMVVLQSVASAVQGAAAALAPRRALRRHRGRHRFAPVICPSRGAQLCGRRSWRGVVR